ncbi:MAG: hypothetical protein LBG11_09960 [Bifidobacteriaceae bacterium]|nr:hypothetical protein [Bifidobacteriaceae bacterium]
MAATLFILAVMAIAATWATWNGWDRRSDARTPVEAASSGQPPALLWDHTQTTVDDMPVSVIYLAPLVADAPLPPGLEAWPSEGEVIASPAMSVGAGVAVAGRYGPVAGGITQSGLTDPGERLLYVTVTEAALSSERAVVASGFGTSRGVPFGARDYRQPISQMLGVEIILLVAPAWFATVAAAGIGAGRRARYSRILSLLGASRADLMMWRWDEAKVAILTAGALSAAVGVLAATVDLPVPGAAYTLQAVDLRGALGMLGCVWVLALIACVGLVVGSARMTREQGRPVRKQGRPTRFVLVRAAAAPLSAAATMVAGNVTQGIGMGDLLVPVLVIGAIVTLAALPVSARAWIERSSVQLTARSWRLGWPGLLVGSAQLAARPGPAARFGTVAGAGVIVLTLLYGVLTTVGDETKSILALRDELGDDLAVIEVKEDGVRGQLDTTWAALSESHVIAAVRFDGQGGTVITGTRRSLDAFGIGDGGGGDDAAATRPRWVRELLGEEFEVVVTEELREDTTQLIVAPIEGGSPDLEALRRHMAGLTVPAWPVRRPGDLWVIGTNVSQDHMRWVTWFGTVAVIGLLVGLWAGYSNELIRAARSLKALYLTASRKGFVASALALRIAVPVALVAFGGGAIALAVSYPTVLDVWALPYRFIAAVAVLAVASAGIALAASVVWARKQADRVAFGVPDE